MKAITYHIESARNAIAIGRILNRAVILPTLTCYCDAYWNVITPRCTIDGSDLKIPFTCPNDAVFNTHSFENVLGKLLNER